MGFWETLSIGVGSTIGGSIFVILGDAVGMAGPAVVLAFGLGAAITLLIALNYSELATSLPISGGGYVFTREAVGGLTAFVTGWFLWLGNVLYAALNAVGFALILARYLAVEPVLVAEAVLAVFCLLNIKGVREVGRAQLLLTVLLISGLMGLSLAAIPFFSLSNMSPLAPRGLEGVLSATGFTFVAYWGFENIATVGGEVREPEKNIPRACILSVLASGAIYMFVSLTAVGALGWRTLAEADVSLLSVGRAVLGPVGEAMVLGLGAVAMLTSLNTALLSAARIAHALAKDGLFPEVLVGFHPRFKTPYKAVALSAAVAAAFALSGIAHFLAGAASFGFLIGLLMVNLSVILLRRRRRYLVREFKVPLYPLTPLLAAISCLTERPVLDPERRIPVYPFVVPGYWDLEGVVGTAGGALRWLRETLFRHQSYAALGQMAENSPPGANGVCFFPHLSGANSPHWLLDVWGAFTGLSLATGPEDIVRSVFEGVAFQIQENLDVLDEMGLAIEALTLFGGGAQNPFWVQMISDIAAKPATATEMVDVANWGACLLAGIGAGVLKGDIWALSQGQEGGSLSAPRPDQVERYRDIYARYRVQEGQLMVADEKA